MKQNKLFPIALLLMGIAIMACMVLAWMEV